MATYKYDVSVINTDINKMKALANKAVSDLVIDTQNVGSVIEKVQELVPQLNALHTTLNSLIAAAATATQATLEQMIQLDDEFAEIMEEGETVKSVYVEIED